MRRQLFLAACAIAAAIGFASCQYGFYQVLWHGPTVAEREGELRDDIAAPAAARPYAFVVISDVHFGKKEPERHDDEFIAKLKEVQSSHSPTPSFCICLGDIADHGRRHELEEYNTLCARIEAIVGGKIYNVVGNHDLYNSGWNDYKELVYPHTSFYRFRLGGYSYYFLDAGSGSLGTKQFEFLKEAMEAESGRKKIVSLHYPVFGSSQFMNDYYALQNESESTRVMDLFGKNNVRLILAGHVHTEEGTHISKQMEEYILPSYLEDYQFAVVTVNEAEDSISHTLYTYH